MATGGYGRLRIGRLRAPDFGAGYPLTALRQIYKILTDKLLRESRRLLCSCMAYAHTSLVTQPIRQDPLSNRLTSARPASGATAQMASIVSFCDVACQAAAIGGGGPRSGGGHTRARAVAAAGTHCCRVMQRS